MKRLLSALLLLFMVGSLSYGQPWIKILKQNKPQGPYTYFDYVRAFEQWEKQQGIVDGYIYKDGKRLKAPYWKQFKRWQWIMESQVNMETGEFPSKTPEQIWVEYLKQHKGAFKDTYSQWTDMGPYQSPGGYAGLGRVNRVAFHPSDTNTFWVGTPGGGLWVTYDNAQTWQPLTDSLLSLGISDIVIHPDYETNHTIYIATGDRDSWHNPGIGVMKSTDGGQTWQATGLSFALSDEVTVSRLLMDPNDPNVMLASTTNGFFKTTDGGNNWTSYISDYFIDMETCPADFNIVFGSVKGTGIIKRSTDGGQTWTTVLDTTATRIELAVTPADPAIVYAVAANSEGGLLGIFKSVDTGQTFTMIYDGSEPYHNILGYYRDGSTTSGQGSYDLAIAVSPTDPGVVLVGGINTWKSTDGGYSWRIVNHWYGDSVQAVHADKHELRFRSNGTIFEGNDGGIYVSYNQGESGSWEYITSGMVISQMYRLGVTPQSYGEVITGLQDNGTKLLSGGEWYDVKGGDGMECIIDYTDLNIQYGTYVRGQISRTMDHWQTSVHIEPSDAGSGAWVTPYIINPHNPQILYAGYADLWKTYNRGDSWIKISDINTPYKLRALAIAPSDTNVIYMADYYHLWKTTDGGQNWTEITEGLPIGPSIINYLAVKYDDPNTIWVALSGYNEHGVYQSIDGGKTWENISDGLPNIPVYTVIQNRLSMDSVHLYAGTQLGVFFKNGAAPWVPYNKDLPKVIVNELDIYYSPDADSLSRLRAATWGRGLWESPLVPVEYTRPAVSIYYPDSIASTFVVIRTRVMTEGKAPVQLHGICWSTEPHPTIDDNVLNNPDVSVQPFVATITDLKPNTTYYIRGYALNKYGVSYSSEMKIRTSSCGTVTVLSEDFESGEFPEGWVKILGDSTSGNDVIISSDQNHTDGGTYSLRFSSYNRADNYNQYVFTSPVTLMSNSKLVLWVKKSTTFAEHLYYAVTTDVDTNQDWVEIPLSTSWEQIVLDLSDYTGEYRIALRYYGDYLYYVYVDDIQVTTDLPCVYAAAGYDCVSGEGFVDAWLSDQGSAKFYLLDSNMQQVDSVDVDTNYTRFTVTNQGTYYVTANVGGFALDTVATNYAIVPVVAPDSVVIMDPNVAPGETVVLHYYGGSGERFAWYEGSCGGTLLGYGNDLIVTPTEQTIYYGRWESDCEQSECKSVAIFVPTKVTDKDLVIYPNPVKSQLTIKVNEQPYLLELYNTAGQLLIKKRIETSLYNLNVEKLPAGTYMLKIIGTKSTHTLKFIKQ